MKRTIIIKGNKSKCYEEIIFIMKNNFMNVYPDFSIVDKIINNYKVGKLYRLKNLLECIFYIAALIFMLIISIKIAYMI
jgi:hypothetical protein